MGDVESAKKKREGSMKTYLETNEDNASKKHFQASKDSNNSESPGQIQGETKSREVSKDREDHFDSYQDIKSKKEERLKKFRENKFGKQYKKDHDSPSVEERKKEEVIDEKIRDGVLRKGDFWAGESNSGGWSTAHTQ